MLSDIQKREFVRDGYIRVPDAIPMALVNRALRAVNHSIGNVGKGGKNPERNRSAFFCAELLQADVILDLYRKSDVMQIAELNRPSPTRAFRMPPGVRHRAWVDTSMAWAAAATAWPREPISVPSPCLRWCT